MKNHQFSNVFLCKAHKCSRNTFRIYLTYIYELISITLWNVFIRFKYYFRCKDQKIPLLLVSLDGFKPDYLLRKLTPTIERLYKCGATHSSMTSVYPSMTFPNHFSIVTVICDFQLWIFPFFFLIARFHRRKCEWWNELTINHKKSSIIVIIVVIYYKIGDSQQPPPGFVSWKSRHRGQQNVRCFKQRVIFHWCSIITQSSLVECRASKEFMNINEPMNNLWLKK